MADEVYLISQITLPDGHTYDIKDAYARQMVDSLAAGSLSFIKAKDAASTPEGVTWDNSGTTVTGTAQAIASNKGKIYLVPQSNGAGKDIFAEYTIVDVSSTSTPSYVWEKLGDTEINFSNLGSLAYKNNASGSVSFTTADSASFSNGAVSASATYTPAGSVSVTLSQTSTSVSLTKADYTPAGDVHVELDQTATNVDLTRGDYTPAGTVSTPTITVTPSTTTVKVLDDDGSVTAGTAASFTRGSFSGGSFTQGTDQFTAPTLTTSVTGEVLSISFSQGSFTQGSDSFTPASHGADTFTANTPTSVTLPTFADQTVATGITSATSTQPSFTGTKETGLKITAAKYDKATVDSASFTGTTAENALVTAASYDKAGVSSASFSGTEATISSTGTATGDVSLTKTSKTETVTVS